MEALKDSRNLSPFGQFEEDVGRVEEASLEEEDKGNPLIVGFVLHRVVVILASCDARVDGVLEVVGQGEGAHDVAVGVHHVARDRPVVRVAGLDAADEGVIANILDATDKKATGQEDECCEFVVEAGHPGLNVRADNWKQDQTRP